jgi:UDP-N-acetylmuramyl tripeptide synthase
MILTIVIAKTLAFFLKFLNIGNGDTLPGRLLNLTYPQFLHQCLKDRTRILVYITGTNGKTSTTAQVSGFVQFAGQSVVTNSSGANLLFGLASSYLKRFSLLRNNLWKYGIFEVDEGVLPTLIRIKCPDILVFLNLTRDQLDRYGEPEVTLLRVADVLSSSLEKVTVFYKKSDPNLENFPKIVRNNKVSFLALSDFKEFSEFNKNVAQMLLIHLGFSKKDIVSFQKNNVPAFGRGEVVEYRKTKFAILLAKNPASFDENLKMAINYHKSKQYIPLFILNDSVPDGRDVSWIYDISDLLLRDVCNNSCSAVLVSGSRAYDFALRLELLGISLGNIVVVPEINNALVKATEFNTTVLVFPTYSGMLAVRKIILGKKIL